MSTIHIYHGNNYLLANLDAKVQYVPFKIHADSDAKVGKYFDRYVKNDSEDLKASFRGYPLMGRKVDVPEGYKGVVLQESLRREENVDDRRLNVVNTFNDLTLWNWDKVPDRNDAMLQALEWIMIAECLHSPIISDDNMDVTLS